MDMDGTGLDVIPIMCAEDACDAGAWAEVGCGVDACLGTVSWGTRAFGLTVRPGPH